MKYRLKKNLKEKTFERKNIVIQVLEETPSKESTGK